MWVKRLGVVLGTAVMLIALPSLGVAGPIEDATAAQAAGEKSLKRGKRRRKKALILKGVGQLGGALLLLKDGKLENDAPALIEQLQVSIADANNLEAVKEEKAVLRGAVIGALEVGDLAAAFKAIDSLRTLDPSDSAVSYGWRTVKAKLGGEK